MTTAGRGIGLGHLVRVIAGMMTEMEIGMTCGDRDHSVVIMAGSSLIMVGKNFQASRAYRAMTLC